MAHIEKRTRAGTTAWRARYRGSDGRERSRSFGRRIDAEQFLAGVEVAKQRGAWTDPQLARIPFEDWANMWLRTTSHLKPKTMLGYESLLRSRILPTFGPVPIGEIRPLDIRTWLADLQRAGLSASRRRSAYHLVGAILRAAVEDRRLAATPCVGIKLPPLPQLDMAFLQPSELKRVLEVVEPRHRAFVEVLATGGLRFGEAAALRVGRCDLARSRITVAESLAEVGGKLHFGAPKTHQRRVVHLPQAVSRRLEGEVEGRSADALVFQGPHGGPVRYTNFASRVWKPALRAAGLPEMGLHALRHTCAAVLIAQGAHPKAIQSHLGHRSITTTLDRYGHLFDDVHERLAERVDAAYADLLGVEEAEPTASDQRTPSDGRSVGHELPDGLEAVSQAPGIMVR